ncbi:MAG TPA: caspase family protein [Vicinamibacterales bacterium]|jgi:hypothetical protein
MAATWRIAVGALTILLATVDGLRTGPPVVLAQTPTRYALVIGLNEFRNLNGRLRPLQFANADATEVGRVLERYGYRVTQLVNNQAKREDIVGELNRLARTIRREDTFVLFFAGHGVQNASVSDTSTYWLTYDARLDAPDVEGIRLEHLMDYVRDIRAERKLVLLDHCFSGRVAPSPNPAPSGSIDATQPGGSRGGGDEMLAVSRGAEPVPGWSTVRTRSTGFISIGASRDLAFEKDGHGLFTSALLAALNSRAADVDKNGSLTALELVLFLPNQMDALAKKYTLTQRVEPLLEGRDLGSWELVNALPVDSIDEAIATRQRYFQILDEWVRRNFLAAVVRMKFVRLIEKWQRSVGGQTMDPIDAAHFEQMRGLLEDRSPEQERARALADLFNLVCAPGAAANAQSELCR